MKNFFNGNGNNDGGGKSTKTDTVIGTFGNLTSTPNNSLFPELSYSERLKYFFIGLMISITFTILSWTMLLLLSLKLFSIFYTMATMSCLFSIMFLVGPMEQLRSMISWQRLTSTILLLIFIVLTLVSALHWKKSILAIIFSLAQFFSFLWYAFSYIPYGHTVIQHFFTATCSCCCL